MRNRRPDRHNTEPEIQHNRTIPCGGIQVKRLFQADTTNVDDLAAALRLLLQDSSNGENKAILDLPSSAFRVTHVVEATPKS